MKGWAGSGFTANKGKYYIFKETFSETVRQNQERKD